MEKYIQIGRIVAVHGIKGELIIVHQLGKKTDFKKIKALFIEERKNEPIPWFPVSGHARNEEETVVQLEGITTPEAARRLIRKNVWLAEADFEKSVASNAPMALLGYMLYNGNKAVAPIEAVIPQSQQLLLQLTVNGKEVIIPLHQDMISRIDTVRKALYMQLPEGLLEIYTGEA